MIAIVFTGYACQACHVVSYILNMHSFCNYASVELGQNIERENGPGKVCSKYDRIIGFHIVHGVHIDCKAWHIREYPFLLAK